jgi:hypothetical protein
MTRAGYSVADLTELANYPAINRKTDQPIAVGSENAWYIYKSTETAGEDLPNIVEPSDGSGRYLRMHVAPSGGAGNGGGGTIGIISAPPTSAPSGIGEMLAQNTVTLDAYNFPADYDPEITLTLSYRLTRRAMWIATTASASGWQRLAVMPTILEFLNIAVREDLPDWLPSFNDSLKFNLRSQLGVHPTHEGEVLELYLRSQNNLVHYHVRFFAYAASGSYWIDENEAPPSIAPHLAWIEGSYGYSYDDIADPNWDPPE